MERSYYLTHPILSFKGLMGGLWNTSALLVTRDSVESINLSYTIPNGNEETIAADLLHEAEGKRVWRWRWKIKQTEDNQVIQYQVSGGGTYSYVIPAIDEKLRIAYGSCFGFHGAETMKNKDKEAMWKILEKENEKENYHLMIMGGDQIYADALWEKVEVMADWLDDPVEERENSLFTDEMEEELEKFYLELYTNLWGAKYLAGKTMSQIPTLMMWDDHDIFDGWGSYPAKFQNSPVYQGIYKIARKYFRLFQLQARDDQDLGEGVLLGEKGFTYAYRVGEVAIVALDMRSERTPDRVMSMETFNSVKEWMDTTVKGENGRLKHLLLLSSIPLVYVNMNLIEDVFGLIPGHQELEDDFKDQWHTRSHKEERIMLIHRLLNFSQDSGCRVTIVSGDVHMAALGYIHSNREGGKGSGGNIINQLISSAMVNTPPPGMMVYMLDKVLGGKVEEVDRGITASMLKFAGTSRRFIGARNWLSLTLDSEDRIWGEWFVEGEEKPFTKVIHPINQEE